MQSAAPARKAARASSSESPQTTTEGGPPTGIASNKFTDDALSAVAKKAVLRRTGARGLRSIMEAILLESMYELPSMDQVEEIAISAEVVEGGAQPLQIYADRRDDVGTSA